jgi:hypothetical protein
MGLLYSAGKFVEDKDLEILLLNRPSSEALVA